MRDLFHTPPLFSKNDERYGLDNCEGNVSFSNHAMKKYREIIQIPCQ